MTLLEDLQYAVNCAVLEAMDKVLVSHFGPGAMVRDADLPKLFPGVKATTEVCLRNVHALLPETLDVSADTMVRTRRELDDTLIRLGKFTQAEIELIRHVKANGASSHDEDMDAGRSKAMLDLLDRDLLGIDENGTLSIKQGCLQVTVALPVLSAA